MTDIILSQLYSVLSFIEFLLLRYKKKPRIDQDNFSLCFREVSVCTLSLRKSKSWIMSHIRSAVQSSERMVVEPQSRPHYTTSVCAHLPS